MTLRVTFLGTAGAIPTVQRNPSAVLVNRDGDRLLFDCGEGTQRQMMRYSTGFTMSHVFVTHLHGDHALGIPGLVQTWEFNDRDAPLAIHGPPGTRREIETLVGVTGNRPSYPVRVHQVAPGDVALSKDEYEVRAFTVDHDVSAVGYALVEADRKGRFDRQKAEQELGIPPGPKYSKLHEGQSVELDDGRMIDPEQVVGPPRPGRRVVYTGDTRPAGSVVEAAEDADLLVHDATFTDERADRADRTGHSTAGQAADVAVRAGADRLALTHISSRYAGDVSGHERVAREVVSERGAGCRTFVPADGEKLGVPLPDEDRYPEG
jgi:ribonuclease Z